MGLRNWRRNGFAAALLLVFLCATVFHDTIRYSIKNPDGTRPNAQGKYIKCVKVETDGEKKLDCHEVSPPWQPVGGPDDGSYDDEAAGAAKARLLDLKKGMAEYVDLVSDPRSSNHRMLTRR